MAAGSIWIASAAAQSSTPNAAPLATAVESAWQRAVAAREAAGQLQRAEAERIAASSLWAAPPTLEFSHRNDRWQTDAGRREQEIGIAWPLWLPGQRDARGAVAASGLGLAEEAGRAARLRIAGEVRELAWTVIGSQAEVDLAEALVKSLTALATDVERRVGAGDLARSDGLAARAELLSAASQLALARQKNLASRARWAVLTGLDMPPVADEAAVATPGTVNSHPEYLLAERLAEHARKRLALVRASRSDPPEIVIATRQDHPDRIQSTQNSLSFGVRLPLGTADRNRPLQAAAMADLQIAETTLHRLRDRLESETATARNAVAAAALQLENEHSRANLLRERHRLIEKSFRAGESGLPELLRTMATMAQAEAAVAQQQAGLGLARSRYNQSLGLLP